MCILHTFKFLWIRSDFSSCLTFFFFYFPLDSGSLNLQQHLQLVLELSSYQRDRLQLVRDYCLPLYHGAIITGFKTKLSAC